MLVQKIHHVAYRCKDAKETVDWYVKHLDMKFVLGHCRKRSAFHQGARPLHARLFGRGRRQRASVF